MSDDVFSQFAKAMVRLWENLLDGLRDPEARKALLSQAGLRAPDGAEPDQTAARATLDRLRQRADRPNSGQAELVETLSALAAVSGAVRAVVTDVAAENPGVAAHTIVASLLRISTATFLRHGHPAAFHVLMAVRVIDEHEIHIERLPALLSGAGNVIRGGPGMPEEEETDAWSLLLGALATASLFIPEPEHFERRILYGWDLDPETTKPEAERVLGRMLTLDIRGEAADDTGEVGGALTFVVAPKAHGGPGLFVSGGGRVEWIVPVSTGLELRIKLEAAGGWESLIGSNGFFRTPPGGPDAGVTVELTRPEKLEKAENRPWRVGTEDGVHLEVRDVTLKGEISTRDQGALLKVDKLALVIPRNSVGPLKVALPSGGLRLESTVGFGLSGKKGFYVEGGARLRATIPIGKRLVGITIHSIDLALVLKTEEAASISLEVAGAFAVDFWGVVQASADGVGVGIDFTFPAQGEGAAHGAELKAPRFIPPKGVGVVIHAGPLQGGGYLFFDPERREYGGALELGLMLCGQGFYVKAVGLLTERPDGGTSFIVMVSVEFNPAIELFLRFTLSGLGVILGVNHGLDLPALRQGVHSGAVDRLLFPKDPVANAPAIINTLRTVFPARDGNTLIGPMFKLTWGGEVPIVTVVAAVVISTPDPAALVLLGRLQVALLHPDAAFVLLRCDFAGAIDFSTGDVSIDASLNGSRVGWFPVTGDLAFRSGNQAFLLSVGGLHPRFSFDGAPALRRVGLDISANPLVRIRAEGYLAVTANTLQFGARIQLDVEAGPFGIHGWFGFDAMFETEPRLRFSTQVSAGIELRFEGETLAGLHIDVLLEGPGPWHVAGRATLTILFWDISVPVDETWGEVEPAPPAPLVEAVGTAKTELRQAWSWRSELPAPNDIVVTLRSVERAAVTVHPLGRLTVRQRALPFGIQITRIGTSPVAGGSVTVHLGDPVLGGGVQVASSRVRGMFPRGQYIDLKPDDALSAPSFEQFEDGVAFGAEGAKGGRAKDTTVEYETILIGVEERQPPGLLDLDHLSWVADLGAVARSGLHHAIVNAGPDQRVRVLPEGALVADRAGLRQDALVASAVTFTEAAQRLAAVAAIEPARAARLQVVGAHEALA